MACSLLRGLLTLLIHLRALTSATLVQCGSERSVGKASPATLTPPPGRRNGGRSLGMCRTRPLGGRAIAVVCEVREGSPCPAQAQLSGTSRECGVGGLNNCRCFTRWESGHTDEVTRADSKTWAPVTSHGESVRPVPHPADLTPRGRLCLPFSRQCPVPSVLKFRKLGGSLTAQDLVSFLCP